MATAGTLSEEKDPYATQEAEYEQLLDLLKNKPATAKAPKGASHPLPVLPAPETRSPS